jgi:hypothetical protein
MISTQINPQPQGMPGGAAGIAANPNAQAMLQQFLGQQQALQQPVPTSTTSKLGTPITLGNEAKLNLNAVDGGTFTKGLETGNFHKAIQQDPGYQHYLRLSGKQQVNPAAAPPVLSNNPPPINWSSLMSGQPAQ